MLKSLGHNRPKKAFILAGGSLSTVFKTLPRAMVKIHNKPLLEHNILLLKKCGVQEIIIAIGEKGNSIKEHFGDGQN